MEQTEEEKRLAKFYDEVYTNFAVRMQGNEGHRDLVAYNSLKPYLGKQVSLLDFGCGNGHTLHFLHSMYPDNHYSGVDVSEIILRVARYILPDAEFYTSMPENGKWDIILCMGVAEHAEDPGELIKMLGKKLSRNGVLYLEVPNCLAYSDKKEEGFRRPKPTSIQEEWHYTRDTWEKIIGNAGLRIAKAYKGEFSEYEFIWVLR